VCHKETFNKYGTGAIFQGGKVLKTKIIVQTEKSKRITGPALRPEISFPGVIVGTFYFFERLLS